MVLKQVHYGLDHEVGEETCDLLLAILSLSFSEKLDGHDEWVYVLHGEDKPPKPYCDHLNNIILLYSHGRVSHNTLSNQRSRGGPKA